MGELISGFVEEPDRGQSTLLSDALNLSFAPRPTQRSPARWAEPRHIGAHRHWAMEKLEVRSVPERVSLAERAGVLGNASGNPIVPNKLCCMPDTTFSRVRRDGSCDARKRRPEISDISTAAYASRSGECAWPPRRNPANRWSLAA